MTRGRVCEADFGIRLLDQLRAQLVMDCQYRGAVEHTIGVLTFVAGHCDGCVLLLVVAGSIMSYGWSMARW